jgi:hypothetical protein
MCGTAGYKHTCGHLCAPSLMPSSQRLGTTEQDRKHTESQELRKLCGGGDKSRVIKNYCSGSPEEEDWSCTWGGEKWQLPPVTLKQAVEAREQVLHYYSHCLPVPFFVAPPMTKPQVTAVRL